MTLKLSEIAEYCEKATPGPWDSETCPGETYEHVFNGDGKVLFDALNSEACEILAEYDEYGKSEWDEIGRRNLHFCAHARTDLPKLTAWAKRARLVLMDDLEAEKYSLERWERSLVRSKPKEAVLERISKRIADLEQLLGEVEV